MILWCILFIQTISMRYSMMYSQMFCDVLGDVPRSINEALYDTSFSYSHSTYDFTICSRLFHRYSSDVFYFSLLRGISILLLLCFPNVWLFCLISTTYGIFSSNSNSLFFYIILFSCLFCCLVVMWSALAACWVPSALVVLMQVGT